MKLTAQIAKHIDLILLILLVFLWTSVPVVLAQTPPVTVTWFVGLGTGSLESQQATQLEVVQRFNESQSAVRLEIMFVDNIEAAQTLRFLIDTGQAPDIVGPVGLAGANAFNGDWLDLEPLVNQFNYDLSGFPRGTVEFYRQDGRLVALPFGVSPSALYYNRDLFDRAGVPYPPQEWGAPYADGQAWTFDKLRDVAMRLTLDANGRNALSPAFDEANIVQWGFMPQWTDARGEATFFGAGTFVNPNGHARIPETWWDAFNWYYDGIWTHHFIPGDAAFLQDGELGLNPFGSGKVAMVPGHLWLAASTEDVNWDLAALPSYEGVITAKLHADSFRILSSTPHPALAFSTLRYLLEDADGELIQVYGMMPARITEMNDYFVRLNAAYPQGVNWQVIVDSLQYIDNPSSEAPMPNYNAAMNRIAQFREAYRSTPAFDVNEQLDALRRDLDRLFREAANGVTASG